MAAHNFIQFLSAVPAPETAEIFDNLIGLHAPSDI